MQFSFHCTDEEYREAMHGYEHAGRMLVILFWALIFFGVFVGIEFLAQLALQHTFNPATLAMSGVCFLLAALNWKGRKGREAARRTGLSQEIHGDIDANGVALATKSGTRSLPWEAFGEFRETPNLFLLFESRRVYIFPKRAFSGAEQESFRKLASTKVEPERWRRRK